MVDRVWISVKHDPAGDALYKHGGIGEPGMWICRVESPDADTGEFRMDEPRDIFDAPSVILLEMLCRHDTQAAEIIFKAIQHGSAVYIRENDEAWPEVLGCELPETTPVGPAI